MELKPGQLSSRQRHTSAPSCSTSTSPHVGQNTASTGIRHAPQRRSEGSLRVNVALGIGTERRAGSGLRIGLRPPRHDLSPAGHRRTTFAEVTVPLWVGLMSPRNS
jgi:hypothetical protein